MKPARTTDKIMHNFKSPLRLNIGKFFACFFINSMFVVVCAIAQPHYWETVDHIPSLDYEDIDCADSNSIMAVGNWANGARPTIRRTTDGGKTWTSVIENEVERDENGNAISFPIRFIAISHPSPDIAIVAADSGLILRTYDQGSTWDTLNFGFDERFRDVAVTPAGSGIATTINDRIFLTNDSGKTWEEIESPGIASQRDIAFYDGIDVVLKVFTGPENGVGVRTKKLGEKQWNAFVAPNEPGEMFFATPEIGWLVGFETTEGSIGNDLIYSTTDGGKNWTTLLREQIEQPYGLYSIAFADENHGIAGGYYGKILRTSDGGKNWIVDTSDIRESIFHVVMKVSYPYIDLAYAVSQNGHIVRYKPTTTSVDDDTPRRQNEPVTLYPNPATQTINIKLPKHCLNSTVELFDAAGRKLRTRNARSARQIALDVNGLEAGLHIVRLSGCGESYTQTVMIAR